MTDNLVLITVDSLRADHLSCYGYDRKTTPYIDGLSDEGHVFENTFAHACSTRPSFPSILTSTFSRMYGGFERIKEDRTLVSEPLSTAGYRTAGFHSNPYLSSDFGYNKGWDRFFEGNKTESLLSKLRGYARDKLSDDGLIYKILKKLYDETERQAGIEVGSIYVTADDLTDHAIRWGDEVADGDRSRFLWIHYMDAHHPYVPPAEHQLAFRDSPISDRRSIKLRRKMLEQPEDVTDTELADIIDLYDAEIRFIDTEIGRLVDHIEKLWGDTTVLFTADHGEEFREHGRFSHYGTFHDEVVHVPFIINDSSEGGQRHDEMVGLLDISPTVLDYAGLDQPDSYLGHSVRRVIDNEPWPRTEVSSFRYCRTPKWKFIRDRSEDSGELYDLTTDPGETTSVAQDYPETVGKLQESINEVHELINTSERETDDVEMDQDIQNRLQALGYKE